MFCLLVIVPGLCYNRGAAARRGCVVWAFRFCFGWLCGAPFLITVL
nr:MAG TPA: hypothetical protein [Caudoviricetes sp.]